MSRKRKLAELPFEIKEQILLNTNLRCVNAAEYTHLLPYIENQILDYLHCLMYSVSNKKRKLTRIGDAIQIVTVLEARDVKQHIRKTLFELKGNIKSKIILHQFQKVYSKWLNVNIGCDECLSYNKQLQTCFKCFKEYCCINVSPCSNCFYNTCSNCKEKCGECHSNYCVQCKRICHKTQKTMCYGCIDECNICKDTFVSEALFKCSECPNNVCLADVSKCQCNNVFCSECFDYCISCNINICNNCTIIAENQKVCINCFDNCQYCGIPILFTNPFYSCIPCYYDSSITE